MAMFVREAILVFEEYGLRLPADLSTLEAFRRWARSDAFPEEGRIDWLDGEVRIDMSPEDLNTHGSPKMAISRDVSTLVETAARGVVYVDRARLTEPRVGLSSEPDVTVVHFESIEAGRVRVLPRSSKETGRYIEIQGAADLVVEVVSDSSVEKDFERLPALYYAAGVQEFWRVDARGPEIEFEIFRRGPSEYVRVQSDTAGFHASQTLGRAVRLVRLPEIAGLVRHRLEIR